MWNNTRATKILGAQYPILQGPFGGKVSTVQLAATVSNAGGIGGYGAYTLTPQEIYTIDAELKKATNKPYNINLWISDADTTGTVSPTDLQKVTALFQPYFDELGIDPPSTPPSFTSRFENQIQVILDTRPPVFSFVFGIPSPDILAKCKQLGIVTVGAATTLDEALALEAAGVDMIAASGFEAGGHRPSFLASSETSLNSTFVLLQQIKEKVRTPVIAAGGIATGKGIAAALALGADAVQIGTAFLACEESNIPDIHRERLFSNDAKYTTLTRAYTGRLGRGLRNKITEETRGQEQNLLPFPLQSQFMSALRKAAIEQKRWEFLYLWSGQIAPILKHKKAAELMQSLIDETTDYFQTIKQS